MWKKLKSLAGVAGPSKKWGAGAIAPSIGPLPPQVHEPTSRDSMEYQEWFQRRPWMQTATGRRFFLDHPEPGSVSVLDVASALARICRFGGHLRDDVEHYSVAQHSVLVSLHCKPENALLGLFHDAHEAYWGDIISPESAYKGDVWRHQENMTQIAIGMAIGAGSKLLQMSSAGIRMPPDIKHADNEALATERRDLRGPSDYPWTHVADVEPWPGKIIPLRSHDARRLFLARCAELGLKV